MKLAVVGLWHLGTVTSAVFAEAGHDVIAVDDPGAVAEIDAGRFPVLEDGLPELWASQRDAGRLRTGSLTDLADRDVAWICFDTPLDAEDRPDVGFVRARALAAIEHLKRGATVVVSSQLPVGSIATLRSEAAATGRDDLGFAAVPENLRLGSAIAYLRRPDRFVVGSDDERSAACVEMLLAPLEAPVVRMSTASAEMTKHALNAFLATSVAFANEIATIAEGAGADAREVERGLKSDARIGAKAYVRAGEAFDGGTLARDLGFLASLAERAGFEPVQLAATRESNERHKAWLERAIASVLGNTAGARVALLGLVYKPGTDTLRSSPSLGLAHRLRAAGAQVTAFDPAIRSLPLEAAEIVSLAESVRAALNGADAAVVMTAWPQFRAIDPGDWSVMRRRVLIDPQRFLESSAAGFEEYIALGRPRSVSRA